MQDFKYTGTNPYDLMQQSRAGQGQTPSTTPATETAAPVDPNQDLYNQLMGMSQQRLLTDRLAGLDEQQQVTSQTYSQMYQDLLRNQRMQRGLSDTRGFSGGMADQYSEKLGASQIAALGQVGIGREAATRDIQSQRRMAPFETALQAGQIQQFATSLDPRRQQLNTLAEIGATQEWADLYNQIYPGSNLQYDPETGTFGGGGTPEPEVTTPTVDLTSPTILPGQRSQVLREASTEVLQSPLNTKETNRLIEKYGVKQNYDAEFATINRYQQGQMNFDQWAEINEDIFNGRGTEEEYISQVGGRVVDTDFYDTGDYPEDRVYFSDGNNPFLLYLVENYPTRFGQDTKRTTPAHPVNGNYIQMTAEEATKAYEEFLKNR